MCETLFVVLRNRSLSPNPSPIGKGEGWRFRYDSGESNRQSRFRDYAEKETNKIRSILKIRGQLMRQSRFPQTMAGFRIDFFKLVESVNAIS